MLKQQTMTDTEFLALAAAIGTALNANRAVEDAHRAAGRDDAANTIYYANKETVRSIFAARGNGMSAREFDTRLRKLGGRGRRVNVKLERIFR